ncbi:uncharacterized protein LOC136032190 isoform X1 [Artemia franciscana]|uniref:Spaetzle domain-containing protein n=1 Tax=Artemia franciscana TaxID=6661 RepID=A0AA88LD28_ARTSF|nr:hypothetical protein QYM36_000434 [Artemia franciscana]
MILKELVKILQICQVIALILSSANAFPHAKARFVFPEVESLASFAEPRGLTFGSSSEREELGKRPIIPRTEAKISLGFQKVIQSATKKPTRHKPLNFKPDKIVFGPSIINKTKIYDENADVEVLPSLKPGGRTKEDMVFFPDDVELITTSETPSDRSDQDDQLQGQPSFEAKPCANDVMCDDSEEYPGDAVLRRVLSNFEAVKEFFRQEADVSVSNSNANIHRTASIPFKPAILDTDQPFSKLQASIDIGTRRGQGNSPLDPYYEVDEKPLCIAESITRYPRRAKTASDNWLLVVNHENYTQGVRIEKCVAENSECFLGDQLAPLGYKTVCRQKFAYRKLLAITPDGRTIAESFSTPSCCTCHVKLIYPALRSKLKTSLRRQTSPQRTVLT